jgi:hypothetical protein
MTFPVKNSPKPRAHITSQKVATHKQRTGKLAGREPQKSHIQKHQNLKAWPGT